MWNVPNIIRNIVIRYVPIITMGRLRCGMFLKISLQYCDGICSYYHHGKIVIDIFLSSPWKDCNVISSFWEDCDMIISCHHHGETVVWYLPVTVNGIE